MKQTMMLRLDPSPDQHAALLSTLERFNEAANWVASIAFEHNTASKYILQKLVYRELRSRFGLSAQMAIRCIGKVSDAFKRDKSLMPSFRSHGAMIYDQRIMSFKGLDRVSLLTLTGRIIVPIRLGDYQASRMDRQRGQADLLYRNGVFYLAVTLDAPEASPLDPEGVLGVDLGIVHLATTSDGEQMTGASVELKRRVYAHRRRNLQRKGTKSAKRKLRKLSGQQARYQRDMNHCLSKRIVTSAQATGRAIGLEDLTGIRDRTTVKRRQRARFANWGFYQLRSFIDYKARLAGVPLLLVDPRNTSRTCSRCGYCDKANRKDQATFLCGSCGLSLNADHNAAANIAARAVVMLPNEMHHLRVSGSAERQAHAPPVMGSWHLDEGRLDQFPIEPA